MWVSSSSLSGSSRHKPFHFLCTALSFSVVCAPALLVLSPLAWKLVQVSPVLQKTLALAPCPSPVPCLPFLSYISF